jgi:hypothetical protein
MHAEKQSNLAALTKEFMTPAARRASRLMSDVFASRYKTGYLRDLLRHHEEKAITDEETWLRDEVDYLLSFYSILEIAALLGLIEVTKSDFFRNIQRILAHPDIVKYYSVNYKLLLPQLFLTRLNGANVSNEKLNEETICFFYEFLPLVTVIEKDSDVEAFLWFMDGGERGGYDYEDIIQTFTNLEDFAKCLSKTRGKNPLDKSVQGFAKFIRFCIEFDSLLNASSDYPKLQAEMFGYHSYWFIQCSKRLGRNFAKCVEIIDDMGGQMREETLPVMKRLLGGKYGHYLKTLISLSAKKRIWTQNPARIHLQN